MTGASRGFGKHLAVEFIRTIQDKAVDLVSRSQVVHPYLLPMRPIGCFSVLMQSGVPCYSLQHLVARTQSGLAETEKEVPKREVQSPAGRTTKARILLTYVNLSIITQGVNVWQWPVDLGDLDGLPVKMDEIFNKVSAAYPPGGLAPL